MVIPICSAALAQPLRSPRARKEPDGLGGSPGESYPQEWFDLSPFKTLPFTSGQVSGKRASLTERTLEILTETMAFPANNGRTVNN